MADILSVIQDVLTQDKQQKKEHAKMMREVQKKMKEKEVSEEEGDGDKYEAFVRTMLKKFGVKSPAELAPDKKKEFYDALDKGWKADDEKPEKDESLGDRVKARMEQEDEDEAPVGDPDEPEEEDEPSEEMIDKIADLVVQKLKDKADEEEDEEEAPEPTEAESGKKEKVDTKPKMEAWESSANPHARYKWLEALRQVNEHCGVCDEQGIEEVRDHKGEIPEPIKVVIQSFGKKLSDYAKKSGGIDKDLFLDIAKDAMAGKLPNPKYIWRQDTSPRDFVLDSMAKEFGWMYVEDKYNVTFRNRRDYVEQVELAISEVLDQEKVDGRRRAFKEAIRRLIYRKMKEARRQKVKEWWDVTLREDWVDDDARKVERRWSRMNKRDKMKFVDKMETKADKSHDYTWPEVIDALDDHGIDVSKEARKQWEEVEATRMPMEAPFVLEAGVTGPTRMQVQKYFEKEKGLLRARIKNTEKAFKIKDLKIHAKGDVISFKEEVEIDEVSAFEALTDIIKVLQERPEFSNFIPLDRKFYETFAKKAKKAGLKWDTFEKYVKGTFKDNADKSKALLFAKDVFKESVELEEAVDLKKLRKQYDRNEDKNKHTENYLLLAKNFGTPAEVKKVQEIMKRNKKQGSTSLADNDWMYKNINKYYDNIRNIKEDYISDPGTSHIDPDTDRDYDLKTRWSSKNAKPAKTDKKYQKTPDKTGTSKTNPPTKSGKPVPARGGELGAVTVKKIEGDNPNKLSVGTKSGTPKKAVGDAKKAKIVDPIGKGEKGFKKEEVSFKEKLENWGINLKKEGYMVMPGIDREKYTEMRGLEGPFMTRSGKVLYYDPKAGEYYDRDSDIYLSYAEYQSLDQETPAQKAAMKQGSLADPKSPIFKKMIRDKKKAEKAAKKQYSYKMKFESLGVTRARKFYQKEMDE